MTNTVSKNVNYIGLNPEKVDGLAQALNDLLSNYQVFYMDVRGYHWNIKGEKFFELHAKFEELYSDLQIKIDEIAERVLTLGETPRHSFSAYLKTAEIGAAEQVSDGYTAVKGILEAFRVLISKQRDILYQSDEAQDEGTNALMSDYIREQEKLVWMYAAFLG